MFRQSKICFRLDWIEKILLYLTLFFTYRENEQFTIHSDKYELIKKVKS